MSTAANTPPKPEYVDVHYEEDLLVVRIRGPYDEPVARFLESLYFTQASRYGYRFVLFRAKETTTITREARRLMAEWAAINRDPAAAAIVGASFTTKIVAQMLVRASNLMTKRSNELHFFDTEAEARAWLEKERPLLEAQARANAS